MQMLMKEVHTMDGAEKFWNSRMIVIRTCAMQYWISQGIAATKLLCGIPVKYGFIPRKTTLKAAAFINLNEILCIITPIIRQQYLYLAGTDEEAVDEDH